MKTYERPHNSTDTQKGNIGEELTDVAFHSVKGAMSRGGKVIANDKVDLRMVKDMKH
jgi:hypothetical protein